MVGLPEYGVTLTGTPAEATIVNNSGKGLIGYVLRLEYASGTSDYRRNLNTRGLRLNVSALGLRGRPGFLDLPHDGVAIPPGGMVRLEYPAVVTIFSRSQVASTQPVKVVLDALIFAVSQFVGPDMGQRFEVLANQLIAEQELAQRVSAARNECQTGDHLGRGHALGSAACPPGRGRTTGNTSYRRVGKNRSLEIWSSLRTVLVRMLSWMLQAESWQSRNCGGRNNKPATLQNPAHNDITLLGRVLKGWGLRSIRAAPNVGEDLS